MLNGPKCQWIFQGEVMGVSGVEKGKSSRLIDDAARIKVKV
jgi:hypothetical protein